MFCSNCGKKLEYGTIFCVDCGKATRSDTEEDRSKFKYGSYTNFNRYKNKKVIVIGIIVIFMLIVAVIFMANRTGISGTWVSEIQYSWIEIPMGELGASIRFTGSRFIATHYEAYHREMGWMSRTLPGPPWDRHRVDDSAVTRELIWTDIVGLWASVYEEGRNFERGATRFTMRGTYSISGDRLELRFSDGSIQTFDIRRTENTLDIGRTHFIRR